MLVQTLKEMHDLQHRLQKGALEVQDFGKQQLKHMLSVGPYAFLSMPVPVCASRMSEELMGQVRYWRRSVVQDIEMSQAKVRRVHPPIVDEPPRPLSGPVRPSGVRIACGAPYSESKPLDRLTENLFPILIDSRALHEKILRVSVLQKPHAPTYVCMVNLNCLSSLVAVIMAPISPVLCVSQSGRQIGFTGQKDGLECRNELLGKTIVGVKHWIGPRTLRAAAMRTCADVGSLGASEI
jgi:hypothetical protein